MRISSYVPTVFFSFTSTANHIQDFLTYHEYDLGHLVKTDEIVSNSVNSIRIAADCMDPLIKNMTKTLRSMDSASVPDLVQYTEDFKFLANYIRGHVENISQYCSHASSKIEVMFKAVGYMELICNNINAVVENLEFYMTEKNILKKGLISYIFDIALIEQFFYDSCDKIMTPIRFIEDRNRELKYFVRRIGEFTNLIINDTTRTEIVAERLLHDSDDIYLAASQMLNVTEKIKIASDYLYVGKETVENKTIVSTKKFNGYRMFKSNLIFLISRSVSAFMKITKQKYVSANAPVRTVSNKELLLDEGEYYEKNENEIKVDEIVCEFPRTHLEINNSVEDLLGYNKQISNLSISINGILTRIRRETPTTKELSRVLKRDAIRINKLLRDIMYRAKYLVSLIRTCHPEVNSTRDVTECVYYCADEVKPVCGVDSKLGYSVFLNKCMLYGYNKCRGTQYIAFDIEICMPTRMKDPQSFRILMGQNSDSREKENETTNVLHRL